MDIKRIFVNARRIEANGTMSNWHIAEVVKVSPTPKHVHLVLDMEDTKMYLLDMPAGDTTLHVSFPDGTSASAWYNSKGMANVDVERFEESLEVTAP